jgi:hypothetical protein
LIDHACGREILEPTGAATLVLLCVLGKISLSAGIVEGAENEPIPTNCIL